MAPPRGPLGRTFVVVLASALLALGAFAPLWGFLVAVTGGLMGLVVNALVGPIASASVLPPEAVFTGLVLALGAMLVTGVLHRGPGRKPVEASTGLGAKAARWLGRHPWWVAGAFFVLGTRILGGSAPAVPRLDGAFVMASAWWVIFSAVAFGSWASWRGFRWMYRSGFRSTPAAAAIAGSAVLTLAGWTTFGVAAAALAESGRAALRESLAELSAVPRLPTWSSPLPRSLDSSGVTSAASSHSGTVEFAADSYAATSEEPTGDELAACFQSLTPELHSKARGVAASWVRSRDDVEDVIRQALLDVCLNEKPPSEAPGYFIVSVRNGARHWRGKSAGECSLDELPQPACPISANAPYPPEGEVAVMKLVLCALPDVDRALLEYRYFEGLSHREIAARISSTEGSVRHRVRNAVAKAKREYSRLCPMGE